jgi:hypothetical protein
MTISDKWRHHATVLADVVGIFLDDASLIR